LGEMGLFLRLADVVVMGGSFSAALEKPPVGGHNPLEPARLGKPAVTGPDMSNWAAVADHLVQAGGLAVVDAPWELPAVLAPLLADEKAARAMGERGRRAATEAGSGLDRLMETLDPLLPPAPFRGGR
ncbi:MAG TPA: 3-deoxy-D-manno-octulosonic acid transferase, partial [Brevundimonas sp.]|nr:3-deoxy-D-manno-octulosonic acid transferase [Brevundimonas sp.]